MQHEAALSPHAPLMLTAPFPQLLPFRLMGDYLSDHFDLLPSAKAIFSIQPESVQVDSAHWQEARIQVRVPSAHRHSDGSRSTHAAELTDKQEALQSQFQLGRPRTASGYLRMLHNSDE